MASTEQPNVTTVPSEDLEEDVLPDDLFTATIQDGTVIRNDRPFAGWSPTQVDIMARRVARRYGQQNNEAVFLKAGAFLLDPNPDRNLDQIRPALDQAEKDALRNERKATFFDQPSPLLATYMMLFLGAIVQGWSQTGTNGGNLTWPCDLLDANCDTSGSKSSHFGHLCNDAGSSWRFTIVNAAPYFAASLGCWVSDPLNEKFFGRRPAIILSAMLVFMSSIGAASVQTHWWALLAWRIVLGLGMGCKAAVIPVFMAEIAPIHLRGKLVMNWQVFDTIGILLGFSANVIVEQILPDGHHPWKWQLASLCIPSYALLCAALVICWDSPRFLMKHELRNAQRYKEKQAEWKAWQENRDEREKKGETTSWAAFTDWWTSLFRPNALPYRSLTWETLLLLRGQPILAAKELLFAHAQLQVENFNNSSGSNFDPTAPFTNDGWWKRVRRLFSVPYSRQAGAASSVMLCQQLCGINVLIFYSTTLYCQTRHQDGGSPSSSALGPLMLTFGIGCVNFLFALPAYKWIETHGRRWLTVFTSPFLILTMACAAIGARFQDHHPQAAWITVAVFTYLFTVFYSPGLGPVPFTYSAEVFPLELRMVGMSLAVSTNFLFAGILTLFVPRISRLSIGTSGLLGIFAALNFIAFVLLWRYVPELVGEAVDNDRNRRKPVDLTQLFHIFRYPMTYYRRYQRQKYVPYVKSSLKGVLRGGQTEPLEPYSIWVERERSRETRGGETSDGEVPLQNLQA